MTPFQAAKLANLRATLLAAEAVVAVLRREVEREEGL